MRRPRSTVQGSPAAKHFHRCYLARVSLHRSRKRKTSRDHHRLTTEGGKSRAVVITHLPRDNDLVHQHVREIVREKEITRESTSVELLVRIQLLHPSDVIALVLEVHRGGIVLNTEHLRGVGQTMGWDPGIFSVVLKYKSQARSARLRLSQQVQAGPSILP